MKGLLRTAATAIVCLLTLSTATFAQKKAAATEAEYGNIVVYLETAKWDQTSPYNNLCRTYDGRTALTGCVPTAYAILMQYHKWPESAEQKKVYHSGTGESITLGNKYDWENMLSSYSGNYSDAEAEAVATLMRDLGWAYGVEYGKQHSIGCRRRRSRQTHRDFQIQKRVTQHIIGNNGYQQGYTSQR